LKLTVQTGGLVFTDPVPMVEAILSTRVNARKNNNQLVNGLRDIFLSKLVSLVVKSNKETFATRALVHSLLTTRRDLESHGNYQPADQLRELLSEAGVEITDTAADKNK